MLYNQLGSRWSDMVMRREAVKGNRVRVDRTFVYRPEDRMRECLVGCCALPSRLDLVRLDSSERGFWVVPVSFASSEDLKKSSLILDG
jgi:hypothetical protein